MASVFTSHWTAPTPVFNPQCEWTCVICDRPMAMIAQRNHLAGKKHIAMVEKSGQYEEHQELLRQQPPPHLQSPPPPPPPAHPAKKRYSLEDLPEVDPQQPLPPVGESPDPVKLSYLRMKKQMEYYRLAQVAAQSPNATVAEEAPAHVASVEAVLPVEVSAMDSGDTNDQPITNPANAPGGKSVLKRYGHPASDSWVEPEEHGPPSAALASLKAARYIEDFSSLVYPADILSPKMALNSIGKFIYERDFLLQFQPVVTEKPTASWDKKIIWAFGHPDTRPLPQTRTTSGLGPRSTLRSGAASSSAPMGAFGSFKPVSLGDIPTSVQQAEQVKVNSPPRGTSDSSRYSPIGKAQTSAQRFEHWRAAPQSANPFASLHTDRTEGVDAAQASPEGVLEGSDILKLRTGNRSSRGGRRAKGNPTEEVESGQGDSQPTPITDGDSVGGISGNGSYERPPPHEKYPIPDKPPYTVHIGNLNFGISEEQISEFFSECDFMKVKLIRDKIENRLKGFGYAEFNSREGLVAAMELNGAQLSGRNIRINVAAPPKPRRTSMSGLPTSPLHPVEVAPTPASPKTRPRAASLAKWRDPIPATPEPPVDIFPAPKTVRGAVLTPSSTHDEKTLPKAVKQKWECTVCDRSIDLDQKEIHLAGKSHARKLAKSKTAPGGNPDGRKLPTSGGNPGGRKVPGGGSVRSSSITDEDARGLAHDTNTQLGMNPGGAAYNGSNNYFGPGQDDYW